MVVCMAGADLGRTGVTTEHVRLPLFIISPTRSWGCDGLSGKVLVGTDLFGATSLIECLLWCP